jgi:hypothetical protein
MNFEIWISDFGLRQPAGRALGRCERAQRHGEGVRRFERY